MRRQTICSALSTLALTALLALPTATALAAQGDSPAGSVKSISGEAQVARDGAAPAALKPGDRIFEKDVLTTGPGGSVGLVMRDNSTLSLGPGSRLVVERFLFAPEKNALTALLRLKKGSLACSTGEMAKLSPESMQFLATGYALGIRGTHFLMHVEDGPESGEGR
ncbi:MAG: hypothetical protein C0405_09060 [Desulfovibrio sp.]|nr:hypothetical protein [Desulfovibrio sp.]